MEHGASPPDGGLKNHRGRGALLAAGAAAGLVPWIAGQLPGDPATRLEHLVWGYGLGTLPWLWVLYAWRGLGDTRRALVALLAVQIGVRALLLTLPPLLSEDVWRYVWDGATQWAGLNPYAHAPQAAAVDAVAAGDAALAAVRAQIGHAHIPTIYPPAAQLLFAGAAGVAPHPTLFRALMALLDLGVTVGLWRWARALGRPPQLAAIYALSPLAALETAIGGHVDVLGVAALVWGGAWLAGGRAWRGGIALGVGVATKLLPLLALPRLALRAPKAALACVLVVGALALPYLGAGDALLDGLRAYGHRWRANDGAFRALLVPFEHRWPPAERPIELSATGVTLVRAMVGTPPGKRPEAVWPDEASFAAAKLAAGLLFGAVLLVLLWRVRELADFVGGAIAALLLLSPVVHPWYLLWLLPLCALAAGRPGARWPWPLIGWGGLVWLAYLPRPHYLRTGAWHEAPAAVALQYLPVWIGLAVVATRGLLKGAPRAGSGQDDR